MKDRNGNNTASVDAIVVGAGATGGVAAMALTQAGLRVLVLEAGPELSWRQAFGWEPFNSMQRLAAISAGKHRLQIRHPGYWKHNPQLYVDERQNPFTTPDDAPFLWTRGRQVGGRSLTWGGITLRLSRFEFQAGSRDGHGPSWPIGNRELDPYYFRLEELLGVHGHCDGLEQLPDGCFRPPVPFTPAESHLREVIERELGLPLIHSRGFRLHRPTPSQPWPRSSAQGLTLARAAATGRLRLRSHAVVSHLRIDQHQKRATGVVMVDARDGSRHALEADLVVLCASTIETVRILLHSTSDHQRGGLVDPSGCLGHYLIDHISSARFFSVPGMPSPQGRHELSGAGSCFIPNTVNLDRGETAGFLRGYGLWTAMQRFDPPAVFRRRPREASGFLIGHGEVLPRRENQIRLDEQQCDRWGLPSAHITCRWGPNEVAMVEHMHRRMEQVVEAVGGTFHPIEDLFRLPFIEPFLKRQVAEDRNGALPGYYVHELGGARMASRPEHGVVNTWNQCWTAPNVLVTDGSCWPTAGWQSPTLTEMAITWRACEAAARRWSSR